MNDGFGKQRARCLALLIARGELGADTAELSDPSIGGHEGLRRVRELRAAGHPVHRVKLPNGYWKYWLGASMSAMQMDLWDDIE